MKSLTRYILGFLAILVFTAPQFARAEDPADELERLLQKIDDALVAEGKAFENNEIGKANIGRLCTTTRSAIVANRRITPQEIAELRVLLGKRKAELEEMDKDPLLAVSLNDLEVMRDEARADSSNKMPVFLNFKKSSEVSEGDDHHLKPSTLEFAALMETVSKAVKVEGANADAEHPLVKAILSRSPSADDPLDRLLDLVQEKASPAGEAALTEYLLGKTHSPDHHVTGIDRVELKKSEELLTKFHGKGTSFDLRGYILRARERNRLSFKVAHIEKLLAKLKSGPIPISGIVLKERAWTDYDRCYYSLNLVEDTRIVALQKLKKADMTNVHRDGEAMDALRETESDLTRVEKDVRENLKAAGIPSTTTDTK